jgi:hypothetical protein
LSANIEENTSMVSSYCTLAFYSAFIAILMQAAISVAADHNYEAMRVRELKEILSQRGVVCEG